MHENEKNDDALQNNPVEFSTGDMGCETETFPGISCCNSARLTHRDLVEKKALLSRCNRVEGQIRGVKGMLERDVYCDDILNQLQAVRAALDAISRLVLERHMKSCLIDRVQSGDLQVIDELLRTLQKQMR